MAYVQTFEGTPFEGFRNITSYAQVEEALRAASGAPRPRPAAFPFEGDSVLKLHGEAHRRRRRMESALFRPEALAHYERDVLKPTIERTMAEYAGHRGPDGVVRADLVALTRRLIMRVTGSIVGLDEIESVEAADEIYEILQAGLDGIKIEWATTDRDEILCRGMRLRQRYWARYVQSSLERRRRLLADEGPGALPPDLLSLIAGDTGEEWDDDLILRECVVYLVGAGATTPTMATHAIVDLETWLADQPDQRSRLADDEFLGRVIDESMRLHPAGVALLRVYDEPHEGRSISIAAGDTLFLDLYKANCDPDVFGPDAERFDPDRNVPEGIPRYGLAFGGGRHLCLGLPLAVGQRNIGTDGLALQLIRTLVQAGVRLDPAAPPVRAATMDDRYEAVGVVFETL